MKKFIYNPFYFIKSLPEVMPPRFLVRHIQLIICGISAARTYLDIQMCTQLGQIYGPSVPWGKVISQISKLSKNKALLVALCGKLLLVPVYLCLSFLREIPQIY